VLIRLGVDEEEASPFERRAGPIIEGMRQRASEIAREEFDRTMKRIGPDPEVEGHLAAMAKALVSKLLHEPSARLRQASTDGRGGERLMAAAVEMFGLAVEGAPTGERAEPEVARRVDKLRSGNRTRTVGDRCSG
jgi:glutamyl-tRNA reductase